MQRTRLNLVLLTVSWLLLTADLAMASGPVAVSPGKLQEAVLINAVCPTFSWTSVDGSAGYELVAWHLAEGATDSAEPEAVIEETLPRGAQGWTPSSGRCLTRGGRYAWAVRAIGSEGTEEWSEPSLFTVAPGPTEEEFQEALAIVRRYVQTAAESPVSDLEPRLTPAVPAGSGRPHSVSQSAAESFSMAPAAIHAEPPATTGEIVGVRGVVNSSAGAAGVFNNTAGGTILSGLAGGIEVLSVNSAGNVLATSFSGDGAGLTNLTASDLNCSSCLTGSEIVDNSLSSADLGANSVGSSEIQTGAVGTSEVNSSQVQLRVSGSCPAGSSIRVISSSGAVTCQTDNLSTWQRFSFDSSCSDGFICFAFVGCGSGQRVLGGGLELTNGTPSQRANVTINQSKPRSDTQWEVEATNDSGISLGYRVWATCATVN